MAAWTVVGLLLTSCHSGQASDPAPPIPRVALPMPRTITSHGTVYTVGEVAPNGATLGSSPTTVSVLLAQVSDPGDPTCATLSPTAQVVAQNSKAVYIASFAYQVPTTPTTGPTACAYVMPARSAKPYVAQSLTLSQPLSNRTLIDIKTGEPIGILDPSQLRRPTHVPSGYTQTFDDGFGDALVAVDQYTSGTDGIEIRVQSRTVWGQDGKVVGHSSVDGHAATVADKSYERCVSWSDPPGLLREVCSLDPNGRYLSQSELLKVARSLR